MKILALKADNGGCAHYRINEPSRVVRDLFDVDIRVSSSTEVVAIQDVKTGLYKIFEIKEDVDLIVIQRPLNNYNIELIRQAREQGIATVVDIDDDFETVHPANITWPAVQPQLNPAENKVWLKKATEMCDLVTVSTPALQKYASAYGGSTVIRNCIPASTLDLTKRKHRSTIHVGWSGTLDTHPTDLLVLENSIKNVLRYGNFTKFVVVGDKKGIANQLHLNESQVGTTGLVPLSDYYQALLDYIDIGIVPLEISDFNTAKSYLKLLEFSSLGIPTVASPTAENVILNSMGVGLIASTPAEWKKLILSLSKDGRRRIKIGAQSKEVIREHLTYESNADLWLNAWTKALDICKNQGVKKTKVSP